ncbi:hypothetical protein J6590_006486 [Homalodisca vitripennis]|nr:hypothetical protein J6590_006486 [Homalodisca vitripennis]
MAALYVSFSVMELAVGWDRPSVQVLMPGPGVNVNQIRERPGYVRTAECKAALTRRLGPACTKCQEVVAAAGGHILYSTPYTVSLSPLPFLKVTLQGNEAWSIRVGAVPRLAVSGQTGVPSVTAINMGGGRLVEKIEETGRKPRHAIVYLAESRSVCENALPSYRSFSLATLLHSFVNSNFPTDIIVVYFVQAAESCGLNSGVSGIVVR